MNPKIHIIGTVHIDLMGAVRLNSVLKEIKPDCIAVEHSEKDVRYVQQNSNRKNLEKQIMKALKSTKIELTEARTAIVKGIISRFWKMSAFEITCSQKYCTHHKIPLAFASDLHFVSSGETGLDALLSQMQENIIKVIGTSRFPAIIHTLLDAGHEAVETQIQQYVDMFYSSSQIMAFTASEELKQMDRVGFIGDAEEFHKTITSEKRDKNMAKNLKSLCKKHDNIAFVIGMGHMKAMENMLGKLVTQSKTLLKYYIPNYDGLDATAESVSVLNESMT